MTQITPYLKTKISSKIGNKINFYDDLETFIKINEDIFINGINKDNFKIFKDSIVTIESLERFFGIKINVNFNIKIN